MSPTRFDEDFRGFYCHGINISYYWQCVNGIKIAYLFEPMASQIRAVVRDPLAGDYLLVDGTVRVVDGEEFLERLGEWPVIPAVFLRDMDAETAVKYVGCLRVKAAASFQARRQLHEAITTRISGHYLAYTTLGDPGTVIVLIPPIDYSLFIDISLEDKYASRRLARAWWCECLGMHEADFCRVVHTDVYRINHGPQSGLQEYERARRVRLEDDFLTPGLDFDDDDPTQAIVGHWNHVVGAAIERLQNNDRVQDAPLR